MEAVLTGVELSSYTDELRRVPVHLDRKPHLTFDLERALGPEAVAEASEYSGETLVERVRNLGMADLKNLTVDQLYKVRRASIITMSSSVEDAMRNEPRLRIIHKIENSMWRWGYLRTGWNEIVDAYDSIRRFSFHPDFGVRLDYTTGHNECGHSEYSRTFLDGVFGFLIYYRGQHVMTLGFSIMGRRRLLVQQVQLKNRRGNRWLFKLPRNYMEYVLARFRESFPRHRLHVIDGGDLMRKNLNSYRHGYEGTKERIIRASKHLASKETTEESRGYYERYLPGLREEEALYREKIDHAEADVMRLEAFYRDTGSFKLGETVISRHGLRHYALVA
jgi:hypothetical protein